MKPEQLEKYTSAITLSDMEVFVFPELIYSLVLANIMSPIIWQWRQRDTFQKIKDKNSYRKLMRLKQFIMDEYEFNLDLETWGLTSQSKELKRFEKFISSQDIAKSNALFGYEGDKYYFDVDIRRHFGLDNYDNDIIPYWKTETAEAMSAFTLKDGYERAAGECVSLSTLYAAAAFIVCGIPLEDIYMILTPLHSQNYIDLKDGVLTNNRRLVTKTMWFNGTEISNKAQRALRNEQVTIVAHSTGYVHCLYDDATIDKDAYSIFREKLGSYLSADLSIYNFANFLRSSHEYQKYFQLCRDCHGKPKFLKAEKLFAYEHTSNFRIADETHEKLLYEVSDEDLLTYEISGRIRCDKLEDFIAEHKLDLTNEKSKKLLKEFVQPIISDSGRFVEKLSEFLIVEAKLPSSKKNYTLSNPIKIEPDWDRDQAVAYLQQIRKQSTVADLAFYAYRDMETCDWLPFVIAAIQRNPVSIEHNSSKSFEEVYSELQEIPSDSIYNGKRVAQPDEVANYKTGDGLEKAFLLANILYQRDSQQDIELIADGNNVVLKFNKHNYQFTSEKNFKKQIKIGHD
ncbi:MAG: hypothetical protein ACYST2_05980, partial [Planctomycetota bacterium]